MFSGGPCGGSPGETGDTRDIPQYNKGSLQKTHSQYLLKWRETKAILLKKGTRQGFHSLYTNSI